jgi:hypothetical protein
VALQTKVHHAGFDGKSGIKSLTMLYDTSADTGQPKHRKSKAIEIRPGWFSLLAGGIANMLLRPLKLQGLL